MPGYVDDLRGGYFTRTFRWPVREAAAHACSRTGRRWKPGAPFGQHTQRTVTLDDPALQDTGRVIQMTPWIRSAQGDMMIWAAGEPEGCSWRAQQTGQLCMAVPACRADAHLPHRRTGARRRPIRTGCCRR